MSQSNIPWFSMITPVKGMLSTLRVKSDQKIPWYWRCSIYPIKSQLL